MGKRKCKKGVYVEKENERTENTKALSTIELVKIHIDIIYRLVLLIGLAVAIAVRFYTK